MGLQPSFILLWLIRGTVKELATSARTGATAVGTRWRMMAASLLSGKSVTVGKTADCLSEK